MIRVRHGGTWRYLAACCVRCENSAAQRSISALPGSMNDGGIVTVAGRAVEPPWRLNGRRGGAHCMRQCRAKCGRCSAGAPARMPGATRPAVRGDRRSGGRSLRRVVDGCRSTHAKRGAAASEANAERQRRRRAQRDGRRTRRKPRRARREARARMTVPPRHRVPESETGRATGVTRPAMRCGQAARMTGMPSCRALSTRFSVMPLPGKAMTPFGRRFRSSSLRRNGAARPWRSQSGLQTI